MAFKINKRNFGPMAYLAACSCSSFTDDGSLTDGIADRKATIIDTDGVVQTAYPIIFNCKRAYIGGENFSWINFYSRFLNSRVYYIADTFSTDLARAACLIPTKDDYSEDAYTYTKVDCTIPNCTKNPIINTDGSFSVIVDANGIANEDTIIKGLAVSRGWQDTYKTVTLSNSLSNANLPTCAFGKECNIGYITLDEPITVKAGDNFSISCAISFG